MIEIRSFRRVFDLERRIYSVDQLRLNPGGVPVRGLVYFLALLLASLLLADLPLLGGTARAVPWYARDLLVPGALAMVLSLVRVDGRTFHLAALALLRLGVSPRRLSSLQRASAATCRWAPDRMLMLPDGSDSRLRALRYTGPGAVLVAVEHRRTGAGQSEPNRFGIGLGGGPVRIDAADQGPHRRGRPREAGARQSSGTVISLAPGTRLLVAARRGKARR